MVSVVEAAVQPGGHCASAGGAHSVHSVHNAKVVSRLQRSVYIVVPISSNCSSVRRLCLANASLDGT